MKRSNKKQHRKPINGNGFFQDVGNSLNTVKNMFVDEFKSAGHTAVNKAQDIKQKVLYGREDYPPSVREILDIYGNQKVKSISLHRLVLPSLYTEIMHSWTKNVTRERLMNEPKDKLFHISMWVRTDLGNILCEKNQAINFKVRPKKASEEEVYDLPSVPANLTFLELIENGRKSVGDKLFFTYSAKDNNCGNWIEYILKANGLNTQATHDFIGQDTKKILEGFPSLRKTLNTLTDIAGRADVVLQGGKIRPISEKKDNGLTDSQLTKMCKELKIPLNGIYAKDEIKSLSDGNYIINLNGQSHWTALHKKGKQVIYFDSYGFPAPEKIENLIEGKYLYNKSEIQGLKQTSCGYYAMAFLKYLKGKSDLAKAFDDFLNLFGSSKENNQLVIREILNA